MIGFAMMYKRCVEDRAVHTRGVRRKYPVETRGFQSQKMGRKRFKDVSVRYKRQYGLAMPPKKSIGRVDGL